MVDARQNMVHSHLWDLEQVLEQTGPSPAHRVRSGSVDDIAAADVLVITAAAPLTVNHSRMVYLRDNAAIVAPLLDALPPGWPGTVILVTNPVDPLGTWAQRRTGLERTRLLGYTLNDSLRLRTGIGRVLGVAPGRVQAWTVGEHGDLAVPLWDRVVLDGAPVALDEAQRATVMEFVRGWYVRHVALDSARSSTWTSGLGIARMVRACLDPERERAVAGLDHALRGVRERRRQPQRPGEARWRGRPERSRSGTSPPRIWAGCTTPHGSCARRPTGSS